MTVCCDRDRIVQVLANVVGNSMKFSPTGGHIRVDVAAEGPVVRFTVTDDGPGMDTEELTNLFDRSWQAQRKNRDGVGLGLAIVRGIVEAHGGRVWAESALGEGTRVHFTLAARRAGHGESAHAPSGLPVTRRRQRQGQRRRRRGVDLVDVEDGDEDLTPPLTEGGDRVRCGGTCNSRFVGIHRYLTRKTFGTMPVT